MSAKCFERAEPYGNRLRMSRSEEDVKKNHVARDMSLHRDVSLHEEPGPTLGNKMAGGQDAVSCPCSRGPQIGCGCPLFVPAHAQVLGRRVHGDTKHVVSSLDGEAVVEVVEVVEADDTL